MKTSNAVSLLGREFLKAIENRSDLPKFSLSGDPRELVRFSLDGEEQVHLVIADDQDELTIYYGEITHIHIANYDDVDEAERNRRTAAAAVQHLENFFSGRVEARSAWWGGALSPRKPDAGNVVTWPHAFRKDEGKNSE